VVLTKNEEKNIKRCLKSLDFVDEIIIIDDYSSDNTLNQISNIKNQNDKSKIKIYQRKLNGDFSAQRNFGVEKSRGEWVLFVDGDEEVTSELQKEIKKVISCELGVKREIGAYYIKRRDWFWGREVRFGDIRLIRQTGLIRLIRKNAGEWEGKVHETFQVKNQKLKVKSLKHFINHYPHQSLKEFLKEINLYSSLRADELFCQGKKSNILTIIFYPFSKFILNYFLKLGFLDGSAGFVYAFMMSFHSFLVRTKLYMRINANENANVSE